MSIAIDILFGLTIFINVFFAIFISVRYFLFLYSWFYGKKYVSIKNKLAIKTIKKYHTFGIVIVACNAARVIKDLVVSLKKQKYNSNLFDIYVVADNCTDNTAQIARSVGAIVLERFNKKQISTNFAMQFAFNYLNNLKKQYDAFCYFDANNIVDENWLFNVNLSLNRGNEVVTSFRNTLNFNKNSLTANNAMRFIFESHYINLSRERFNCTSFLNNGTGFCFTKRILTLCKNWTIFNTSSHITEFTQFLFINNIKCSYQNEAILYDEQLETFKQSWIQRLEWVKGFFQVFKLYGKSLFKKLFQKNEKNKLTIIDNLSTIFPITIYFVFNILMYLISSIIISFHDQPIIWFSSRIIYWVLTPFFILLPIYLLFFIEAVVISIQLRSKINCTNAKLIYYCLMYPIFMLTYIPISIVAMFKHSKKMKINFMTQLHHNTKSTMPPPSPPVSPQFKNIHSIHHNNTKSTMPPPSPLYLKKDIRIVQSSQYKNTKPIPPPPQKNDFIKSSKM